MPVPARITLVTLGVADVERAAAFYEALGWRRSPASVEGEVAFFQTGALALALWGYADLAADTHLNPPAEPPPFSGVALAMNLESTEAVVDVLAAAEAAGGGVPKRGEPTDWGGFSGYFTDLDGHVWEVAHNPFWELRPDGSIVLPT